MTSLFRDIFPRRACWFDPPNLKVLIAMISMMLPVNAHAQSGSVERDPFSAPPIEEVVSAADRDRVARITRDLVEASLIEIELKIINEVESRINAETDRLIAALREEIATDTDDRIADVISSLSAFREELPTLVRDEILTSGTRSGSDADEIEGSVFVACVDGRPLYRDANGTTFYANETQGDASVSRCNN